MRLAKNDERAHRSGLVAKLQLAVRPVEHEEPPLGDAGFGDRVAEIGRSSVGAVDFERPLLHQKRVAPNSRGLLDVQRRLRREDDPGVGDPYAGRREVEKVPGSAPPIQYGQVCAPPPTGVRHVVK